MLASTLFLLLSVPGLDGQDRVRAVLQRVEAARPLPEAELARRLASLGDEAAPALFALVRGPGLDELLADGTRAEDWLCPTDRFDDVALAALAQAPPRRVLEQLRSLIGPEPDLDTLLAEARVLAALRSSLAMERFLEIVGHLEIELLNTSVRSTLREALVALLNADLRSFTVLEPALAVLGTTQKGLVCEALVASGRAQAAALLERLLGADPAVRLAALEGLVTLEARVPWRVKMDVTAELRRLLAAGDPAQRTLAASGLGQLGNPAVFPALINGLNDPEARVRRACQSALVRLSGRNDLVDPDAWQQWMQAEARWWREEGQPLLASLQAGSVTLSRALHALSPHPIARQALADALVTLLPDLEPEPQRLVCGTLQRLGLTASVPALIDLLVTAEGATREAAWTALRVLTGQDLPAEPRLWEAYAFG